MHIQSTATSTSLTNSVRMYASLSGRIGRRLVPAGTVISAFLVLRMARDRSAARLWNEAFVTGYSLVAIVLFLMLLSVRKRIISVPIGRLAIWQRTHHYLGMMSLGAYVLHAGVLTTGWLESLLAASFWCIGLSGLVSWYVNRTSPRMLRAAGPQILRQDIAERKRGIGQQAYQLALSAAGNSDTAALAEHYRDVLQNFFGSERTILYRLQPTGSKRRQIMAELENIDRYLNEEGRAMRQQLSLLIGARDDLDFQSAIQNRIRLWAAIHTWLLGGFVVLTMVHVVIAHQFSSSW